MAGLGEWATQTSANTIFVPCTLGWSLQLFLCGIATDRARAVLFRRKTSQHYIGTVPLARPLLGCAAGFNFLVGLAAYWDIMVWMCEQNRTHTSLEAFKWPDIIAPILSACVAAPVQAFMAYRCWRIVNKNIPFAILVASGILLAFAGAIWSFVESVHYWESGDPSQIFLPTQIMLWTNALVDIIITIALTTHLTKLKRGFNEATDHFIDSLVKLSFETCFAPAFFSVLSACLYAAFYDKGDLWNVYIACCNFIPSLYVISMLYCLAGTVRSKRKMESSRSGQSLPHHNAGPPMLAKLDVRNIALPLHQTTSIQWDPPAAWHSQLGNGEDLEKMPDLDDLAFVKLERADTEQSITTDVSQTEGSKKLSMSSLRPLRPNIARSSSDRSVDGIRVVVEQCTIVEEA